MDRLARLHISKNYGLDPSLVNSGNFRMHEEFPHIETEKVNLEMSIIRFIEQTMACITLLPCFLSPRQ